jgi:hypothetical protein
VINRLIHGLFHVALVISPQLISAQWYRPSGPISRSRADNKGNKDVAERIWTHTIDILLHQSLSLISSIQTCSATSLLPLLSARDLDIGPEGRYHWADISWGLMTRATWKRPCINLFITYFAIADNMSLPRRQITRCKLCFYYTWKFGVYFNKICDKYRILHGIFLAIPVTCYHP